MKYELPTPRNFIAEDRHGGIVWRWSAVRLLNAPVEHRNYQIEISFRGEVRCHDVIGTQHELNNVAEGEVAAARVRTVDDAGNNSKWSDLESGKSLHRYKWAWSVGIPLDSVILPIHADGESPEIVVRPELYRFCKKYGVEVSAYRHYWSGSSGFGTPADLRVSGEMRSGKMLLRPRGRTLVSWLVGKPETISVDAMDPRFGFRTAKITFQRTWMDALSTDEVSRAAPLVAVVAFVVPTIISALDTKVGLAFLQWLGKLIFE